MPGCPDDDSPVERCNGCHRLVDVESGAGCRCPGEWAADGVDDDEDDGGGLWE